MRAFEWQTPTRNESEGYLVSEVRSSQEWHHRPIMILGERFESEYICWDPKDGELCLNRATPGETLVEARRNSDVQIDFQIWV